MKIEIYDRALSKTCVEEQFKAGQADFLYNTVVGRILLKFIFATKTFSKLNGACNSGRRSVKKIKPFIETYNMDMTDFEQKEYSSFNDFFTRKCLPDKRPFSSSEEELIAVTDSKLSVYGIDDKLKMKIKNSVYSLEELLKDKRVSGDYKGGVCLVFRLTVDDYHRYCFFDSGSVTNVKTIKGCLHTVGPISSKRYKVYSENFRIVSSLSTDNFGDSIYIEVGALLVGRINNYECTEFNKGDEKGYFSLGGSTIVILFKRNSIKMDDDILEYSKQGIETKVKMGEKIGRRII